MAAPALASTAVSPVLRAFVLAAGLYGYAAHAQEIPPPAYQLAAHRARIPSTVLYAVALQESGIRRTGRVVPWPWSLNGAGDTGRFASRADACANLLTALRTAPDTRIDVGLGQINLGYQKQRYGKPCDLLDLYDNLRIAAEILQEQYVPGEDWLLAIGRYHRPAGGEPAARYRRSVSRHPPPPPPPPPAPRHADGRGRNAAGAQHQAHARHRRAAGHRGPEPASIRGRRRRRGVPCLAAPPGGPPPPPRGGAAGG